MKKYIIRIIVIITVFSCLAGMVVVRGEQPENDPLAAFPYSSVWYTYSSPSAGAQTAQFIYNDGMFLENANALSSDLVKVGVALAMAAYDRNSVNSVLILST